MEETLSSIISFYLQHQEDHICDRTTALGIKPEKSILGLLHILIVDILKSVFPKSDVCRTKIRFLANFQGPSVMQIEL